MSSSTVASASGTFTLGGNLTVNRLGFGAMRITGKGVWGPPADHDECIRVLRRAVELGVNFIDTADSYGPYVSEKRCTPTTVSSSRRRRVYCAPGLTSGHHWGSPTICARSAR